MQLRALVDDWAKWNAKKFTTFLINELYPIGHALSFVHIHLYFLSYAVLHEHTVYFSTLCQVHCQLPTLSTLTCKSSSQQHQSLYLAIFTDHVTGVACLNLLELSHIHVCSPEDLKGPPNAICRIVRNKGKWWGSPKRPSGLCSMCFLD